MSHDQLVDAFRDHYRQLCTRVVAAVGGEFGDSVVLERLGDDLDLFSERFARVWAVLHISHIYYVPTQWARAQCILTHRSSSTFVRTSQSSNKK